MAGLEVTPGFWRGKRVFLTGHTGFKGGWLALWLSGLGAEVHGYSLAPPTRPCFFDACGLAARLASHREADVLDAASLGEAMREARPDIVLHLAAQSLVRRSYDAPVETFAVNVMGTVNVLETARRAAGVRAVVNVTTDKCYENREWLWAYREIEAMGGHDPYSASKGCSELVTAAYRASFMAAAHIQLASARAGNVIGGGDWAKDRLVPDFLRALDAGDVLTLRSPTAIRPWQHVLEPLSGYLTLAERLYTSGEPAASAWNFGPAESDARPVEWIVRELCARVPGSSYRVDSHPQPHEANYLKLDSSKARVGLGWAPRWDLREALAKTLQWHQAWKQGLDMAGFTLSQIDDYEKIGPRGLDAGTL